MLLNKSEIYYQIKSEIVKKSSDSNLISVRDLTFILGIKQSDIQHWIYSGRFGDLKEMMPYIPFQNFYSFIKSI